MSTNQGLAANLILIHSFINWSKLKNAEKGAAFNNKQKMTYF